MKRIRRRPHVAVGVVSLTPRLLGFEASKRFRIEAISEGVILLPDCHCGDNGIACLFT